MDNRSKIATRLAAVLGAVVIVVFVAQPMFAQSAFLKRLKKIRPDLVTNKMANCHLCHSFDKEKKDAKGNPEEADKENVNAFGKDSEGSIGNRMRAAMSDSAKGDSGTFARLMKAVPEELRREVVATALASSRAWPCPWTAAGRPSERPLPRVRARRAFAQTLSAMPLQSPAARSAGDVARGGRCGPLRSVRRGTGDRPLTRRADVA